MIAGISRVITSHRPLALLAGAHADQFRAWLQGRGHFDRHGRILLDELPQPDETNNAILGGTGALASIACVRDYNRFLHKDACLGRVLASGQSPMPSDVASALRLTAVCAPACSRVVRLSCVRESPAHPHARARVPRPRCAPADTRHAGARGTPNPSSL